MLTRRRLTATLALVAAVPLMGLHGCEPRPRPVPQLRMNEIQVLASHNSYHIEPEPPLFAALQAFLGAGADALQYTHHPLADELDAGVRELELDTFIDDPGGGRYADPKLVPALGLAPVDPALREPGLKVFHIQEVDYRSTCQPFVACLEQIREWSDAHPRHLPITIQIEAKDGGIPDPGFGFVTPIPWSADGFRTLESEIRSVFPERRMITPGDVRGHFPTVADAVRAGRWPTLARARGQVMFVLDDSGAKRDAYRSLLPDVDDRAIFVDAPETAPDAAVMIVNDPIGDADRIHDLVAAGFIVRTRADADTVQARSGDTTMRDAAWASGAQFVSTDYAFPDERFGTGYVVAVPGGGAARCNPISAPPWCGRTGIRG